MITISLCMIVKNEEETLERCLTSVKNIANEIIIVDTGSTDSTKQIAARFTNKIVDFTWIDDFAAARNFAFQQATKSYILWLDADDVFEKVDREKFIQLKKTLDSSYNTVMMPYHLSFDHTGKPTFSMRRNRLVRRDCNFVWIGAVHEYLEVSGKCLQSEIAVTHKKERVYTDRNLRIYRKKVESGESLSTRDLFYYANELYDHSLVEQASVIYETFWATKLGWIEDRITSCLKLADCYSRMGEYEKQLQVLFRSFELDTPRAEICCRLAAFFMENKRWNQAKHWYLVATILGEPPLTGGMIDLPSWTWLPHIQLCVCYDRLGNYEMAYRHNEIALTYQPTHSSMLSNKSYLEKVLAQRKQET
ncbi:glycosyltransferase family 2 protein [Paenibacillus psychroresistens]|uniref:Glycosyltransferase family 2 protein n=1 Tax=Paenibacillus psychroresistens TaxID=1778678 RepID=A0A6B8RLT3_9BACL|nr:glycosyltransferase family 2 protein [Paenibacillus psychroresistens]QGQ96503.1 glycosyltransferase family 2 protein [Paenibacillus psychroresistens]